jgi:hypothetical protein
MTNTNLSFANEAYHQTVSENEILKQLDSEFPQIHTDLFVQEIRRIEAFISIYPISTEVPH